MGRILYLEDELDAGWIQTLFGVFLNDDERKALDESGNRSREIREALRSNSILSVHCDFAKALEEIEKSGLDTYDLMIVDRNLYDNGLKYSAEHIPGGLDPVFSERYHTREGDYLIWYALKKHYDLDTRFYIFTGNSDELRAQEGLEAMLSETFLSNNCIMKSSDGTARIQQLIADRENLQLMVENREYIDVLSRIFGKDSDEVKHFCDSIMPNGDTLDQNSHAGFLTNCRTLTQKILGKIRDAVEMQYQKWLYGKNENTSNLLDYLTWEENRSKKIGEDTKYAYCDKMTPMVASYLEILWHVISENQHSFKYKVGDEDIKVIFIALKRVIVWLDDETRFRL